MRKIKIILVAVAAVSLTGCVLGGKQPVTTAAVPVAPKPAPPPAQPPPPSQLSIPQTQVDLPPAQPVTDEALKTLQSPEEVPTVAAPVTRPPRRTPRETPAITRPAETVGPATPPAVTAPPPEPERPSIQEIVSPAEQNRLQGEATKNRREIQVRLDQVKKRHLNAQDTAIREEVLSYLRLSNDAEKQGDMRKAYELAERGLLRAKDLTGGR